LGPPKIGVQKKIKNNEYNWKKAQIIKEKD
jgi:hypothetical protein